MPRRSLSVMAVTPMFRGCPPPFVPLKDESRNIPGKTGRVCQDTPRWTASTVTMYVSRRGQFFHNPGPHLARNGLANFDPKARFFPLLIGNTSQ
jgi:hypothetical protein